MTERLTVDQAASGLRMSGHEALDVHRGGDEAAPAAAGSSGSLLRSPLH